MYREQDSAAAPLKPLPLIVLSQDKPFNLPPFVEDGRLSAKEAEELVAVLMPAVLAARADLVSQVPGAKHITKTNSDHYIHREQPRLVINAVREVIDAVRRGCNGLNRMLKKGHPRRSQSLSPREDRGCRG